MLRNNKKIVKILGSIAIAIALTTSNFMISPMTLVRAESVSYNEYSVESGIANQNKGIATIKGYIVGEPASTSSILSNSYKADNALAVADNKDEVDPSKCIYIQIPKAERSNFGLFSNPSLKGTPVKVTGELTSYFAHAGIKDVNIITSAELSDLEGNENIDDNGNINGENEKTDQNNNSNEIIIGSDYDSTYYKTALDKSGLELKKELHNIIKNHNKLSYSQVWDGIRDTDEDPNNPNNVILLYTGRSQGKLTNGSGVNDWNREHVWAKSHGDFGTTAGAGTDLHHLRATDASVNSTRSNKDFDMGGIPDKEATGCKYDSDSWEPRDEVKGDIARMIFYMAVRYEGDNNEPDLEINDTVNSNKEPYMGRLSVLLEWNKQDPVDEMERRRNEIIYTKYQHNRNPFIDHPEMANKIWN